MPQLLYSRGKNIWYPSKGGWVGPRAGLDLLEKRKISWPNQDFNPESSIP
jgi:hypothetical protein